MNKELISLIIRLVLILLFSGGFLVVFKILTRKKAVEIDKSKETAQDFVNVEDIKDKFLYSSDGYVFTYIQIPSIDINLLSKKEKKLLTRTLTAALSGDQREFKLLAVSKPVDVAPLISDYQEILLESNDHKQKELLRNEISVLGGFALSGEDVVRQFYIKFWEKQEDGIERELFKQSLDFISKFDGTIIKPNILTENEIIKLCNLINNPTYTNIEDEFYNATVPIILE